MTLIYIRAQSGVRSSERAEIFHGARIMTTLIHGLQETDKTYGLETMCVGGGQGLAMIIERLS